jgi:CRISPR-associated exonuclease Cas4
VVEFTQAQDGIHLRGQEGLFLPAPIEYKRGKPKQDQSDEAQLCAQAICLEEMLSIDIPTGYLYYGETRHREEIELTKEIRDFVFKMSVEMHAYFARGHTPQVKPGKACKSCSLKDVCVPELQKGYLSAAKYIQIYMQGE